MLIPFHGLLDQNYNSKQDPVYDELMILPFKFHMLGVYQCMCIRLLPRLQGVIPWVWWMLMIFFFLLYSIPCLTFFVCHRCPGISFLFLFLWFGRVESSRGLVVRVLKWLKIKQDSWIVINEVSNTSLGPHWDGHIFQFIGGLSKHLMHCWVFFFLSFPCNPFFMFTQMMSKIIFLS